MFDPVSLTEAQSLPPAAEKKVAVIVGRFNPPTRGHYAAVDAARKFIKSHTNLGLEAMPVIVVIGGSKSDSDTVRNPLSVDDRISFMQASGRVNGIKILSAKNAFDAFAAVRAAGYEPIAVAAGEERIDSYITLLDKYFTDGDAQIKHYAIELKRDADAASGIADSSTLDKLSSTEEISDDIVSGTLARLAVQLGYTDVFAKIVDLQDKPALAMKMFNKIKIALGV